MVGSSRCVGALAAVLAATALGSACGAGGPGAAAGDEAGTDLLRAAQSAPAPADGTSGALAASAVDLVVLRGAEEVPGPGHPTASGVATVTLVPERKEVCVVLEVADLDRPTAAHLHEAPAGGVGDVVLALVAPPDGEGAVDTCVSAPAALLERLARTPDRFYVNVHSEAHPDGALRGQLR